MTPDDRTDDTRTPSDDGASRYGTERHFGRDDASLYGAGAPGAPPDAAADPSADTEDDLMEGEAGVGPRGAGAFVAGTSGGALGAAAPAAGAALMGSGEARGGMGGSDEAAEGNEASDAPGAVRKGPGTETHDGPISGGQAGTGPQTPAV